MVGRENQPEAVRTGGGLKQGDLFDFTNYPERWAFTTRRLKGKLTTMGVGMYASSRRLCYEVELIYEENAWRLSWVRDYEKGELVQVPDPDVLKDMWREFAYHKATWIAKKRELQGEMTRSARRGWK